MLPIRFTICECLSFAKSMGMYMQMGSSESSLIASSEQNQSFLSLLIFLGNTSQPRAS